MVNKRRTYTPAKSGSNGKKQQTWQTWHHQTNPFSQFGSLCCVRIRTFTKKRNDKFETDHLVCEVVRFLRKLFSWHASKRPSRNPRVFCVANFGVSNWWAEVPHFHADTRNENQLGEDKMGIAFQEVPVGPASRGIDGMNGNRPKHCGTFETSNLAGLPKRSRDRSMPFMAFLKFCFPPARWYFLQ